MEVRYTKQNEYGRKYNNTETDGAILRETDGVFFLEFPAYQNFSFLQHGFSTRIGGVSAGDFATMNLSYSRGDDPSCVDENFRRICMALGIRTEDLVLSDQIHDTVVQTVNKEDCQGMQLHEKKLAGIDGLITRQPGVALCTSYADCVPLFFVDLKQKVIGLSHSGWRGTAGKMGAKTVEKMKAEFGTQTADLQVVIGPSICQHCYQVSGDVYAGFTNFVSVDRIAIEQKLEKNRVQKMVEEVFVPEPDGKYRLDLWMANKLILMEAGVLEAQIHVSEVCTCCNDKLLFSHRKTNGKRGNLAGFLQLKPIC